MATGSDKHLALPRTLSDGSDLDQWLQKFSICATANGWDDATCAKKLPTFLDGEALMVFLELPADEQKDYAAIKTGLKNVFEPAESRFRAMVDFEGRKQLPGESPHAFLFNLKRLLDRALPDATEGVKNDMLLHHFIEGLPRSMAQHLRSTPNIVTLDAALTHARLLCTSVDEDSHTLASSEMNRVKRNDVQRLENIEDLVTRLSDKITQISTNSPEQHAYAVNSQQKSHATPTVQCQLCLQHGHDARNCRNRRRPGIRCFNCGRLGHLRRDCRQRNSPPSRSSDPPSYSTSVSSVNSGHPSAITGLVGQCHFKILLDSGSSISLVRRDVLNTIDVSIQSMNSVNVVTASGGNMELNNTADVPLQIGQLTTTHKALVADRLIVPVILGTDFMKAHGISIDFKNGSIHADNWGQIWPVNNSCVIHSFTSDWQNSYSVAAIFHDDTEDYDCGVPLFNKPEVYTLPSCSPVFKPILASYSKLFSTLPGKTDTSYHRIVTEDARPVRIPPRRVPAHYKGEVEHQIQDMLRLGIISESNSPWMAPCVFVPKKNGELRICVDYRELNKRTQKNSYPLPLPDEVQDRLGKSSIFTKLDCRKGFWQVPIHPDDRYKTAFSPGPGMGLYEFHRMPFGLTGAPGTFQSLMDHVLRGLDHVMVYIDDILIFSPDEKAHISHLRDVLSRLQDHGLTLHSDKCVIGCSEVSYLGHKFSGKGMSPDPTKVSAIKEWPTPTNVSEVRTFLGLVSYYRRYISGFASIAEPLHRLTDKGHSFDWTSHCQNSFKTLQSTLLSSPILQSPDFSKEFTVYTDASDIGLGAVLHQENSIVACCSRSLKAAEKNYSVIEKECLALMYATKQFRHYLLGRPFTVFTDHNPLQWLSAQKMEGKLARWALALQEYDITIRYRKGNQNNNADALSRRPVVAALELQCGLSDDDIRRHQQNDPDIGQILQYLQKPSTLLPSSELKLTCLKRWLQIWSQLAVINGILYRKCFSLNPKEPRLLLVIPESLRTHYLQQCHDIPCAGHQGFTKTLERLRQSTYWIGMTTDTQKYCDSCDSCHQSKPTLPQPVPLVSTPIGKPWEMIAVDILQVPISNKGNSYLLVLQDYFTKWLEAVPMRDQKAGTIATILIDILTRFGMPKYLHSDQGRNFESTVIGDLCKAFGITKSRTTPYHPQGDGLVERSNCTLLQMLRTYVTKEENWEQYLPLLLYAYRTTPHTSTKISPYLLMFGKEPQNLLTSDTSLSYDTHSYSTHVTRKLAELFELVDSNLTEAATRQKQIYDTTTKKRTRFKVGDHVWLSIPTTGKLSPRWESGWTIQYNSSFPTVRIRHTNGRCRTVHLNRIRLHNLRSIPESTIPTSNWEPPSFDHCIVDSPELTLPTPSSRPQRIRRAPDRYGFS